VIVAESKHRDEGARRLVGRLVELARQRPLSGAEVGRAAIALGASRRTIRRWVAAGGYSPPPIGAHPLSARERELFFATGGNVHAVHRRMTDEGHPVPSVRTLGRAIDRELTPAEQAFARTGAEGARARSVYLRWEPEHRAEGYAADHKELSIEVLAPRAQRPTKPWVTLVQDEYSRLIVGWAISLRPTQAEVLAALRMAVVVDPDRGSFGGIPVLLRFDGGLEFAARSVEDAAATLGCLALQCRAYQPWLKGKVERLNRTIEQTLLCELPRWTHGPRQPNGQLADRGKPLTLERFVSLFDAWVRSYNTERPHGGLQGQTPLERWMQDARPVPTLPADQARWMLLPEVERGVVKSGVSFGGRLYVMPEMNGLVGEKVGVRAMPHDPRSIEIYYRGKWHGTAKPQGMLTGEDRARVLARRRDDAQAMAREATRARRHARTRLAPITGPGEIQETTIVMQGERDATVKSIGGADRRAHLRLLGINGIDDPADERGA